MQYARDNISIALSAVEAATQIVGVPFAAGLANEIVKSCEDVARHKRHAKMLGNKSKRLANALEEEAQGLEGTKLQERIDEVTGVLDKIRNRTQKWSELNLAMRWWHRNDMEKGIEELNQELDFTLQTFYVRNQITQKRDHDDAVRASRSDHAEDRELLRQLLTNQEEIKNIFTLHQAGERIAVEVMQGGQEQLREWRQLRTASGHQLISESPSRPDTPTFQTQGPARESASQKYFEMQRGLISLHGLTGIPPTVKKLDGEIRKEGDLAVAGGSYSDIWRGRWLGQVQVALKALRNVKADDKKAQKRFIREINIWSELANKHIVQFYGIVTDIGTQIHMVSAWLENGNVLEYTGKHPDANKTDLIYGAAEGLSYLHSKSIIHGNIKCSNILVSSSGEACISDFGMAKVLEDVTKTAASTTLQTAGSARWLAPEIIEGESPSKQSDTYSFSMTILELITGERPLVELRTDMAVIRAMARGPIRPKRPTGPQAQRWLTDELWELMGQCWDSHEVRPTMEVVATKVQDMKSIA
ncbi:kinase-like protein [Macrolepiota fuliginosa MF-IS2]|uniref:Kinase-like protein n=1 Tax=Macrolepiota fuliginosa MF-IS2 TaxID=1400762 RepID=A0A9P5XAV2_9AGAR|nr:kinase-like protein [Macrolepiota fuliginosa MF-IS2]